MIKQGDYMIFSKPEDFEKYKKSFTFLAKFKSFDNNQEKEIKQSNQIKQPNQINQLNQSLNQSNIFNNSQIKGSNNNYQYPELYKTHHTNNQNQQNS